MGSTPAWAIRLGFAGDSPHDPSAINDRLSDLVERLDEDLYPTASGTAPDTKSDGRYSVRVTVEDDSPIDALVRARRSVETAARRAGLPDFSLVEVDLQSWEEFERELDQPTFPSVVGVSELASMLSVSKQRASELARSEHFPKPFVELAAGPLWLEPNIRDFVANWERRPGRPRKIGRMTRSQADEVVRLFAQQGTSAQREQRGEGWAVLVQMGGGQPTPIFDYETAIGATTPHTEPLNS